MKMFLISDNVDTLTGMRLAGVEGCIVHERAELRKALEDAIANKENGIILLTEKFGREFPDIIDDVRLHRRLPLLIEIPILWLKYFAFILLYWINCYFFGFFYCNPFTGIHWNHLIIYRTLK